MRTSRRSVLAGAAAGLGSSFVADPARAEAQTATSRAAIADLIRRSHQSNAALMRGDMAAYRDFIVLSDDFSFMSPFGGAPTRAADFTDDRMQAMGRFFADGSLETHLVEAYASGNMVVLAVIEHANVAVGGLPKQDWWLRVTLIYRREAGRWLLAHRHADPLRRTIGLAAAAALARNEAA